MRMKKPTTFSVELSVNDDRLDCKWFNPKSKSQLAKLFSYESSACELSSLNRKAIVTGGKRLPKGTVLEDRPDAYIPYIRAGDIKNQIANWGSAANITESDYSTLTCGSLKNDDILISIVGTIGEVGLVINPPPKCSFTENAARIRVKDTALEPRFLLWYLSSDFGKSQIDRLSVGSLQEKLSLASCRGIKILIPVKGKQVDRESQLNILVKVEKMRERANECFQKARAFAVKSREVIDESLGLHLDELGHPDKVFSLYLDRESSSRIDALYNNPQYHRLLSVLGSTKHRSYRLFQLVRVRTIAHIKPSDYYRLIDLEQIDELTGRIGKPVEDPVLGSDKQVLVSPSIVVSRLQPDNPKIAIVKPEHDGFVATTELIALILTNNIVDLDYLWAVLRSDSVLFQWRYCLSGCSRMRITPEELLSTVILVPTSEKIKKEAAGKIQSLLKESDDLLCEGQRLEEEAIQIFHKELICASESSI